MLDAEKKFSDLKHAGCNFLKVLTYSLTSKYCIHVLLTVCRRAHVSSFFSCSQTALIVINGDYLTFSAIWFLSESKWAAQVCDCL